ncbi:type I phosphomannose isomerase catalytic subunit [Telmatobacter bradus]|uniref:type I phosphomannose isomerase catalytic subunit n=1 Tax=Telmatobacter bradus TaxID=474953 RepID=UPI003B42DD2C
MSVTDSLSAAQFITPFRIEPHFDVRPWGFRDLRPWFDRVAEDEKSLLGEAWLTGDMCLVATGAHKGKRLDALFSEHAVALLGKAAPEAASPLLVKMLFAADKLSVQVHPDDKMAQKYGAVRGKTECWFALAAEPGAKLAVGLRQGVTLDEVRQQILDGTLEKSLNAVGVKKNDMIFVDAGTVHAIWPGAIILETQQNCDLTYRMFDYGRPRELHVEKSLEATKLLTRAGKVPAQPLEDRTLLIDEAYFRVERVPVESAITGAQLSCRKRGLSYLFATAGAARIMGQGLETVDLPARAIVAVPASSPEYVVENLGGLDLIRITPKWPVQ